MSDDAETMLTLPDRCLALHKRFLLRRQTFSGPECLQRIRSYRMLRCAPVVEKRDSVDSIVTMRPLGSASLSYYLLDFSMAR